MTVFDRDAHAVRAAIVFARRQASRVRMSITVAMRPRRLIKPRICGRRRGTAAIFSGTRMSWTLRTGMPKSWPATLNGHIVRRSRAASGRGCARLRWGKSCAIDRSSSSPIGLLGGTHWEMKPSTRVFISLDCAARPCAAGQTWFAALPVSLAAWLTPQMLDDTSWVPCAACSTLRAISWVAAPCSSTAAAIGVGDLVDLADRLADRPRSPRPRPGSPPGSR